MEINIVLMSNSFSPKTMPVYNIYYEFHCRDIVLLKVL